MEKHRNDDGAAFLCTHLAFKPRQPHSALIVKVTDDQPLQVLKHDPVPGYGKIFAIVFALLSLYLAIILISSPGPVEHDKGHGKKEKSSH